MSSPINMAALINRYTGKSGLIEVINGTGFMQNGRVVLSAEHFTDLSNGFYKAQDTQKILGQFSFAAHFDKLKDCVNAVAIPLRMLYCIYDGVKTYKRTAGKDAKEIMFSIKTESPNKEWTKIQIHGEGKYGEWGQLIMNFHVDSGGLAHDVAFRFKIDELLDFLYIADAVKDKTPVVELLYQTETETLINQKPLFISFHAYGRTYITGHQVIKELETEVAGTQGGLFDNEDDGDGGDEDDVTRKSATTVAQRKDYTIKNLSKAADKNTEIQKENKIPAGKGKQKVAAGKADKPSKN